MARVEPGFALQVSDPGYLTPERFRELDQPEPFVFDHKLANPREAIDCAPFQGSWVDYFNMNLSCGQVPRVETMLPGCGARDWDTMPRPVYMPPGSHRLRCKACGATYEVIVVARPA